MAKRPVGRRSDGILVDTSAWVELLRNTESPTSRMLEDLIARDAPLILTGLVHAELLRGCSSERDAMELRARLMAWPRCHPRFPSTYDLAARLHRDARRRGLTVRSTIDCVIAALALDHGLAVLHRDRDYAALAKVSDLVVIAPG